MMKHFKKFLFIALLFSNVSYGINDNYSVRNDIDTLLESFPAASFNETAVSFFGDLACEGNQNGLGCGLKMFGSYLDTVNKKDDPYVTDKNKKIRLFASALRTVSYLTFLGHQNRAQQNIFSERAAKCAILRSVAFFASWYAKRQELNNHMINNFDAKKKWGIARIVGSCSRALADCITGDALSSLFSIGAAGADFYAIIDSLDPNWYQNLFEEDKYIAQGKQAEVYASNSDDVEDGCDVCGKVHANHCTHYACSHKSCSNCLEKWGAVSSGGGHACPVCKSESAEQAATNQKETCFICCYEKTKEEFVTLKCCGKDICKACFNKWKKVTTHDLDGELDDADDVEDRGCCPYCRNKENFVLSE